VQSKNVQVRLAGTFNSFLWLAGYNSHQFFIAQTAKVWTRNWKSGPIFTDTLHAILVASGNQCHMSIPYRHYIPSYLSLPG